MTDRRIEDLGDSLAVPRKNGSSFRGSLGGRVFGMAVALSDDQLYAWDDFRDHLVAEIAAKSTDAPATTSAGWHRSSACCSTAAWSPPRSSTRAHCRVRRRRL